MASTGTNLATIKTALVDLLNAPAAITAAGVTVLYGSPVHADDLTADDGLLDAVWLADASARIEVPYVGSQVRHEYLSLEVVCQSVRRGTDNTDTMQVVCDAAAETLLAEVLSLVASDPTLSLTTTQPLAVVAETWRYDQLPPAANARGARYVLTLTTQPAGIPAPT